MVKLDPVFIKAMLEELRDQGVRQFECELFKVTFDTTNSNVDSGVSIGDTSTDGEVERGVKEIDLYSHLGFTPTFPEKDK